MNYAEGARVGYKWFQLTGKVPLFPFGFGLSYTSFAYSDLTVDAEHRSVTFHVKNVGTKYGTEIAEVYARLPETAGENFNRLVGWDRVPLAAGESKSVTLKIDSLYLSVFDEQKKQFVPPHGNYELFVGPSSDRLPLTHTLAMF